MGQTHLGITWSEVEGIYILHNKTLVICYFELYFELFAFSALTLLVRRQEGHPAHTKYGGMVEVGTG